MFISSKLTLPLIVALTIAIGCFGIYQYGKQTEKQAVIIQQQATYVATRTKIDAAISDHPTISANAALARLRDRQRK
jgi:hypothetical protein